jgi:hypothetical protein
VCVFMCGCVGVCVVCVREYVCVCVCVCECVVQGCVIRRIVFNACNTAMNLSGRSVRLQKLPILPTSGLFRQFPPLKRPFGELTLLVYKYYGQSILGCGTRRLGS